MRKKVMAIVFAVLAFSLIAAFAASMPAPGDDYVGVANQTVASCQSDSNYSVDYVVGWAGGEFRIQQANVSGLDANCVGADVSIRLTDGINPLGPLGTSVAPVDALGAATVTGLNASAEAATDAVIAITN